MMSYNVTGWKTKLIEDLKVPVDNVFALDFAKVSMPGKGQVYISSNGLATHFQIHGTYDGNFVEISSVDYGGEASGSYWYDFKVMFEGSTGRLIAVQIWEGGDSLTQLTVNNGQVTEEEFEL